MTDLTFAQHIDQVRGGILSSSIQKEDGLRFLGDPRLNHDGFRGESA